MIITIARQCGCMGDEIGQRLADETIFYSLYAQQTVSDVLYVFLCSIGYYYENGINLSVFGNLLFVYCFSMGFGGFLFLYVMSLVSIPVKLVAQV